jgi:hypothetical protein
MVSSSTRFFVSIRKNQEWEVTCPCPFLTFLTLSCFNRFIVGLLGVHTVNCLFFFVQTLCRLREKTVWSQTLFGTDGGGHGDACPNGTATQNKYINGQRQKNFLDPIKKAKSHLHRRLQNAFATILTNSKDIDRRHSWWYPSIIWLCLPICKLVTFFGKHRSMLT